MRNRLTGKQYGLLGVILGWMALAIACCPVDPSAETADPALKLWYGSYGVLAAILKDGDILYLYALGQESEHYALRRSDDSALILLIFILIDQAQTFIADELFVAYSHPYAGLYLLSATLFQEYAEVGVFLDELQNKLGRFLSHYHPMGHIVVSDKFNHVSRHIILNHVGLYKAHIGRDAFYQR